MVRGSAGWENSDPSVIEEPSLALPVAIQGWAEKPFADGLSKDARRPQLFNKVKIEL